MATGVQAEKDEAEGKQAPHEEGVEERADTADQTEAQNTNQLLGQGRGGWAQAGAILGGSRHKEKNGEKRRNRQTASGGKKVKKSGGRLAKKREG